MLLSCFLTLCTTPLFARASKIGGPSFADAAHSSFNEPPNRLRPRFRYWVPDASVDLDRVAADIRDISSVGAGGVELMGYYLYGNPYSAFYIPADWTKYGWGTVPWRQLQDTVLRAANASDLIVDLTLGPNQGAGVPAAAGSDGLLWDLVAFNITVAPETAFNDILPGWGTGLLVSASTGLVIRSSPEAGVLSSQSLQDLTTLVDLNGRLALDHAPGSEHGNLTIFAYYRVHSNYHHTPSPSTVRGVPQSPVTTFIENGSWVVDHFSPRGAQVTIDFWETHLLNGSVTRDLLKSAGNYMFEDSLEFQQAVYFIWTPELLDRFLSRRGYSMAKYLPILYGTKATANFGGAPIGVSPYVTDEADGGLSHVRDYQQTLTELNQEYLGAINSWSRDSLGLEFSQQVAYGLQMDMLASIPSVDAPELETLSFKNNIDGYRQFAGPAHLAGKRVISSECGASVGSAYQQSIPELVAEVRRSIAGGVNNFIFHGMPYSGDYPNTTWPTFTTFFYLYSEMHGRHQPAWEYYSDFINWTARMQYISQKGVPKVDIAFWLKSTDFVEIETKYVPQDLREAGYTYQYLSPDNFALSTAFVQNGTFAPDAQAFKAIVVRANDSMTIDGIRKLISFASHGFPIILSGGVPSHISPANTVDNFDCQSALEELWVMDSVHIVSYDNLAQSLVALDIHPRIEVDANGTWYTTWREDLNASTSYIYVYNDAASTPRGDGVSAGNIRIAATGVPYLYDSWTGEVKPIRDYQRTTDSITIPLRLAGKQSVVIGVHHTNNSETMSPSTDSASTHSAVYLDNPSQILDLTNWTLVLESWTQPANHSEISNGAVKHNTTYHIPSLVPWQGILGKNLSNVSGRGFYTTTFDWSLDDSTSCTAVIDLGAIFHTARVFINGQPLPTLDVAWARADVSNYLRQGSNVVEVVVSTPLFNALLPIWGDLITSGTSARDVSAIPADYGLLESVQVIIY